MPYTYEVKEKNLESYDYQKDWIRNLPELFVFIFTFEAKVTYVSFDGTSKTRDLYPTFWAVHSGLNEAWEESNTYDRARLFTALNMILEVAECGVESMVDRDPSLSMEDVMGLLRDHVNKSVRESESPPDTEESMILGWLTEKPEHALWTLAMVRTWAMQSVDNELDQLVHTRVPNFHSFKSRMKRDLYHIIVVTAQKYWEEKNK